MSLQPSIYRDGELMSDPSHTIVVSIEPQAQVIDGLDGTWTVRAGSFEIGMLSPESASGIAKAIDGFRNMHRNYSLELNGTRIDGLTWKQAETIHGAILNAMAIPPEEESEILKCIERSRAFAREDKGTWGQIVRKSANTAEAELRSLHHHIDALICRVNELEAREGTQRLTLREPLRWFADQMEGRLRENDYKGGWDRCEEVYLLRRALQELAEVQKALLEEGETPADVICECADVANFMMMLADNARRLLDVSGSVE